jgi:hypothetical protein
MSDEVVVEITESQVVEVLLAEGPRGLQGLRGDTGLTGADSVVAGPTGLRGVAGSDGSQGVQGETGPAVDTSTLSVEQSQVSGLVAGLAGKAGLTGGNTFTVGQVINSGSASTVGAVIRGAAGQTANLQQWQDQNGQPLTNINSFGQLRIRSNSTGDYGALIGASYSANVPLVVKGAAGQTANLQEWQNSDGGVKAFITSSGTIDATTGVYVSGSASNVLAVVKGAPSQSANLQEWQDSSGNAHGYVSSSGQIRSDVAIVAGPQNFGSILSVGPYANQTGAVIRGAAGQTANLQEWQDSSGGVKVSVNSGGVLVTNVGTYFTGNGSSASQSVSGSASTVGAVVRGAAGQTANLQEWQNSAGTAVAKVDATGTLTAANFLQGTGSPLGVVSANVGAIYVDTASTMGASTWQKMSGTGTSGWVVTVGATGRRNIGALVNTANGYSNGITRLIRSGNEVTLYIINLSRASAGSGALLALTLPAGFRPTDNEYFLGKNLSVSAEHYVNAVAGDVWLSNPPTSVFLTLNWTTPDPWPTVLPGTQA